MTSEMASRIATFGIIVVGKGADQFERNAALRCACKRVPRTIACGPEPCLLKIEFLRSVNRDALNAIDRLS